RRLCPEYPASLRRRREPHALAERKAHAAAGIWHFSDGAFTVVENETDLTGRAEIKNTLDAAARGEPARRWYFVGERCALRAKRDVHGCSVVELGRGWEGRRNRPCMHAQPTVACFDAAQKQIDAADELRDEARGGTLVNVSGPANLLDAA